MLSKKIERDFSLTQLKEYILPFWLKNAIDSEYGGYFTCFDNEGGSLLSTDKYLWSQGRFLWILSKLCTMNCFSQTEKELFSQYAKSGANFIIEHGTLENGNCIFLTDRAGNKKLYAGCYDASYSVDCFVIMGMSMYYVISGDNQALALAKRLFRSVMDRINSGTVKTEPYPVPKGLKAHAQPMILVNVCQEFLKALKRSSDSKTSEIEEIEEIANNNMIEVMDVFTDKDYFIREFISLDNKFKDDTLIGKYINPGHTIEDLWFIIHQTYKHKKRDEYIEKAGKIFNAVFDSGWDSKYGGLLLFAGKDGGQPCGDIKGYENEKMVLKVLNDWDCKLWWVHSESLYTSMLLYINTGNEVFLNKYKMIKDYTFKVFPNPDKGIGEWVQIKQRDGSNINKVVALPVKDPYHIARNLILLYELLDM